jgi:cysteinyl-tRNA synthetase
VLAAALGLTLRAADIEVDEESAQLVAERDEARRARDFARADALRDELVARGWTVEDTPSGTAIRR